MRGEIEAMWVKLQARGETSEARSKSEARSQENSLVRRIRVQNEARLKQKKQEAGRFWLFSGCFFRRRGQRDAKQANSTKTKWSTRPDSGKTSGDRGGFGCFRVVPAPGGGWEFAERGVEIVLPPMPPLPLTPPLPPIPRGPSIALT